MMCGGSLRAEGGTLAAPCCQAQSLQGQEIKRVLIPIQIKLLKLRSVVSMHYLGTSLSFPAARVRREWSEHSNRHTQASSHEHNCGHSHGSRRSIHMHVR
jgi:hypothetical protein